MVDGFSTAPLRRDNMSFGGDNHGGDFPFEWDDSSLMGFNPGDELQRILNPFVCTCHGMGFSKKADLNRHIAKETKRFLCDVESCRSTQANGNAPVFGTLNDKKRHYRDVHGTDLYGKRLPKFICPWTNCKRHTDGFPRPKNLENHLKSLHDNQRPEPAAGADAAVPAAALQRMPAPASEGASSATASFSAPAAALVPAPSLARDSSNLDIPNPTPPDSQLAETHATVSAIPLPPLTAAEAADPVVTNYEENISALRAENESQTSTLATIEKELESMKAACSTIKQEIAQNHATEQFLVKELAKRKEAIRNLRTQNAQRRVAAANTAAATATAATTGGATAASPTMQSD